MIFWKIFLLNIVLISSYGQPGIILGHILLDILEASDPQRNNLRELKYQ